MSSLVCCVKGEGEDSKNGGPALSDGDYLLPGGDWDPSISPTRTGHSSNDTTRSRSSIRTFLSRRFRPKRSSLETNLIGGSGEYRPPPLVPSKTLPTFDEFKLLKTVGRGAFGKVMLAVHCETRILYALKVVPKAKITTQKQVEQILAESQILKNIRHPFCVAIQYAFQSDDFLYYVFEFAAGGMLFYHLRKEGRFTEPRARFYFGEIILALDYLHSFGIIFRDLKPENCMLAERGHIVLTDFGSAKMLEVSEKTSTIAGTPQYIAPEVLRGEPYSFSADWWSCGILLYEMLTGKTPFYSGDRVELYRLVLRGYFTVPKSVAPRARALMFRLINKDQGQRIGCTCGSCQFHSASDIKQHNFFSQTPMDTEEEDRYAMEEAEREWEREALESQRRSQDSSFLNAAGSFIRTMSVSARRMTNSFSPYLGVPCEWSWEQLEGREVVPPFKPKLSGPTDLRHFDPTLTCIPPTLSDLITTERSLHVEDFNYVAPDNPKMIKKYKDCPDTLLENEAVRITTVKVTGGSRSGTNCVSQDSKRENTTDEEKAFISKKGGANLLTVASAGQEGQFVEGKLERSGTPFVSKVVVTADVNPQS